MNEKIKKVKALITAFITLSAMLLVYTTINLIIQRKRTKQKEKELEIVLNRISDGVVSIDNNWRYTFLNDAAMETHPFTKVKTIGKIIWDMQNILRTMKKL